MVAIQRESRRKGNLRTYIIISSVFVLVLVVLVSLKSEKRAENRMKPRLVLIERPDTTIKSPVCPYETFDDLSPEELYPTKGSRHMVNPPKGGQLTLLCCETTKGPWSLVVHDKWAPLGAARFLEMVSSRYMDSEIPLFRCIQDFICQFGLSSDASLSKLFKKSIQDDKNWLPEGPAHREHEGVKRFAKGYIAYAGGGKNSRNNQLIISLTDVGALAGGSPWEVCFLLPSFLVYLMRVTPKAIETIIMTHSRLPSTLLSTGTVWRTGGKT